MASLQAQQIEEANTGRAAVIEAEGLTKTYSMGSTVVYALRDASFRVEAGEFVALMGASGSGKSTLLTLLGCLDRPTSGRYALEGQDAGSLSDRERARLRNRRIGFIFQNFNLLPRMSALENVALPLLYRKEAKNAWQVAFESLEQVGLGPRARHLPAELSGGERQRVAIARALVIDPAILLADEPTGSLDSATGMEVLHMLAGLWQGGRTIILVTHDAAVAGFAGRILHMKDGAILDGEKPGRQGLSKEKPDVDG